MIRSLRVAHGLTLETVARRANCSESLLSQVENGKRALTPRLAEALDSVYGAGGALAALIGESADGQVRPDGDLALVNIPGRSITLLVSRRELLAALGIGALGGTLVPGLQKAAASVRADEQLLADLQGAFTGLQASGRILPSRALVGPLTGQVGFIDAVRRHAPPELQSEFLQLQTQAAEALSWMAEESGDLTGALYWTDRVQQWATRAGWQAMMSYVYVRRSMLAISFASDGLAAVEEAKQALRVPGAPVRVGALASKQIAYGYALAQDPDRSKRALDQVVAYFGGSAGQEDHWPVVGQNDVTNPDLLAIYTATCDVYLGGGATAIDTLQPRMDGIGNGSKRSYAITGAKLAQAYAHAGAPERACDLILQALEGTTALDSQSARSELQRVLPALDRWPERVDVAEVRHRLTVL